VAGVFDHDFLIGTAGCPITIQHGPSLAQHGLWREDFGARLAGDLSGSPEHPGQDAAVSETARPWLPRIHRIGGLGSIAYRLSTFPAYLGGWCLILRAISAL